MKNLYRVPYQYKYARYIEAESTDLANRQAQILDATEMLNIPRIGLFVTMAIPHPEAIISLEGLVYCTFCGYRDALRLHLKHLVDDTRP